MQTTESTLKTIGDRSEWDTCKDELESRVRVKVARTVWGQAGEECLSK